MDRILGVIATDGRRGNLRAVPPAVARARGLRLSAVLAACLLAAACGDDGDSGASAPPGATQVPQQTRGGVSTWTPTAASTRSATPTATPCPSELSDTVCDLLSRSPRSCSAVAASFAVPGSRGRYPASIDVPMSCDEGTSSNYVTAEDALDVDATDELHVIGVYEGAPNPGFGPRRRGQVRVTVSPRPKPVILFLSAYEPVTWRIRLEEGARLSAVITQGYYEQEVEGVPSGVGVVQWSREQSCGRSDRWESESGHSMMIASVRDFTGLQEASFQGCHRAVAFDVPHWSGDPPSATPTPVAGDEAIARQDLQFPGCPSETAEGRYCLTISRASSYYDFGPAIIGLDSGRLCRAVTTTAPFDSSTDSIAWLGEIVYGCSYSGGLVRVSLRDGSWEATYFPCAAVVDYQGQLLVHTSRHGDPFGEFLEPFYLYQSFDAVLTASFSATYDTVALSSSSLIAAHAETLYTASGYGDTIEVLDLRSGEHLGVLTLEDAYASITGLALIDGQALLVAGTVSDSEGARRYWLRSYDAASGRRTGGFELDSEIFGLSCVVQN